MTIRTPARPGKRPPAAAVPSALARRFEAIVFDWDGTAVPDRAAPAGRVRRLIEALCEAGFDCAIVSGTHVGNVDGQLKARPTGPGRLHLLLNRGSEVFAVGPSGPELVYRRRSTPEEDAALTAAAELTVARLAERGLAAEIVSHRVNRRKIDVIPLPEWADPPKARIDELLAAVENRLAGAGISGLPEVVEIAEAAAAETGLAEPRVTSDAKHVEIGLTDKADSARWIFAELWRRGIAPETVLVAGDELGPLGGLPGSDSLMLVPAAAPATVFSVGVEPLGVPHGVLAVHGGPELFVAVLEDQLRRRLEGELPRPGSQTGWTLELEGFDPEHERARESLLTLADGRIGTRGSILAEHAASAPAVLGAGLYTGSGPDTRLLGLPLWNRLPCRFEDGGSLRRTLDLRRGLLVEELESQGKRVNALLFSSAARPGTAVMRAEGPVEVVHTRVPLSSDGAVPAADGRSGPIRGERLRSGRGGAAVAARDFVRRRGISRARLDRIAAYEVRAERLPEVGEALQALSSAGHEGFEKLFAAHRAAWWARWEDADIEIEGDPALQLAVRHALFQLMASVPDNGEAGVGARGLSGAAYSGHVFWDSDVFMLPFLAATHPESARAMLEYRIARLPAARAAALASGRTGARFPWESAATGIDVTPPSAIDPTGRLVPIRNGELEEHVVADVAWAAGHYLDWTGDEEFAAGPGLELLVETARYWASRIRLDGAGKAHIYGVIGPDEYHEPVDDNAYTNVMARWNLRRAVAVAEVYGGVADAERERWHDLADALVDGYDPASGLYEQFAGFFRLEPLVIEDVAPSRPIVADALLGRERVHGAQVVKQADVLMLHHLVPDEVAPGSLRPNLAFYEPRTAHGSSLSPPVHAALFARAGQLDEALEALRLSSRLDLDDLTDTTAGGLHLATMGGVWQALAFGFAGLSPAGDVLRVDPHLPSDWRSLSLRVRFRGSRIRMRFEAGASVLHADPFAAVQLAGNPTPIGVPPAGVRLVREGRGYREETP